MLWQRQLARARTSCTASGPTRPTPRSSGSRRSSSPAATAGCTRSTRRPASCSGSSTATRRTPSTTSAARGTQNDFIATPVVHDNKLYIGVGQDPEHTTGVGHLWCIDLTKADEHGAQDRTATSRRRTTTSTRRPPANTDSALVWHYGGPETNPQQAGRDYVFGRTMSTCAVHDGLVYVGRARRLPPLPRRQDRQAVLGARPEGGDLGVAVLGGRQGLPRQRGRRLYIFEHGKQKKLSRRRSRWTGRSAPRRSPSNGVLYVMTESHLLRHRRALAVQPHPGRIRSIP